MITLWRISSHPALGGEGGLRTPARWHEAGHPIVYLAESPAGALLEVCVHTAACDPPPALRLHRIVVLSSKLRQLDKSSLTANWQRNLATTRALGTAWLRSRSSLLLRVPSALLPETWNVLFNPAHPAATRARLDHTYEFAWDPRLKL